MFAWLDPISSGVQSLGAYQPSSVQAGIRESPRNLILYPNPASGKIYLRIPGPDFGVASYRILDLQGRVFQRGILDGSPEQELRIEELVPGLYFLRVTAGGFDEIHKLIVE